MVLEADTLGWGASGRNGGVGPTRYGNLFTNTGHGTLGWTMACGSGRLLADLVSGITPDIAHSDLAQGRYGTRSS